MQNGLYNTDTGLGHSVIPPYGVKVWIAFWKR